MASVRFTQGARNLISLRASRRSGRATARIPAASARNGAGRTASRRARATVHGRPTSDDGVELAWSARTTSQRWRCAAAVVAPSSTARRHATQDGVLGWDNGAAGPPRGTGRGNRRTSPAPGVTAGAAAWSRPRAACRRPVERLPAWIAVEQITQTTAERGRRRATAGQRRGHQQRARIRRRRRDGDGHQSRSDRTPRPGVGHSADVGEHVGR